MGVIWKKKIKGLQEKNQILNEEINIIKIRNNELESKQIEDNKKLKELKNNNKLLSCYCMNLQYQLCSLIQQHNLNWNIINNMNVHINPNHQMNSNINNGPLVITLIFNINQKEKITLPVLSNNKLCDIFQYIISKLNYTINFNKIRFNYNSEDITNYFHSDQCVSSLKITSDYPMINVTF